MTLVKGPWPDRAEASDPEQDLPIIMPGRSPKKPGKELEPKVFEPDEILEPAPTKSPADATKWQPPPRRPVIEDWLKDPREVHGRSRHRVEYAAGIAAYHLVRLPLYAWRAVAASPRGLFRSMAGAGRWVSSAEFVAAARAAQGDRASLLLAEEMRSRRASQRSFVLLLSAVPVGVAIWLAPGWLRLLLLVAAVTVLGVVGRRSAKKPIISHAVDKPKLRKLTHPVVTRAFLAAKLCSEKEPLEFRTDVTRDGPGSAVVFDLPYGTTADEAIKRRVEVASGLDYDERCVFLSRIRGGDGSARRVKLWVADEDPLSKPAGRSPLLTMRRINFWQPLPWGLNERGDVVQLCMLWLSLLVGSIPRRGKSWSARTIALAAALDPDVRIYVYDLKGGADWKPFRHVAHRIQFGDRADPETGIDPVEQLLADMQALQTEVDHRYRTLRHLPDAVVPEGKLTEELARSKDANMPLVLVVLDEVQRAFEHKTYGQDLEDVLTDLVKVAPAVGVMLLAATQKPDKTATPSRFRDQFGARFALRCPSWQVSDVILGAGAYSDGYDASRLPEEDEIKGVGILRGTGDVAVKGGAVRTYLADGRDAEAICRRARQLREAAHTLTGVAAGEAVVSEPRREWSVVADLLTVMDGRENKLHSDILCKRLMDQYPDRYRDLDPRGLAAMLKTCGIETDRNTYARRPDGNLTTRAGLSRQVLLDAGL